MTRDTDAARAEAWLRLLCSAPVPEPLREEQTLSRLLRRYPRRGAGPAAEPLRFTSVPSRLGTVYLAYSEAGIAYLSLTAADDAAFAAQVSRRYGCPSVRDDSRQAALARSVQSWFEHGRAQPQLDLSRVTEFERKVLLEVARIRPGTVRPYNWVARAIGAPKAVRAVGMTMARNPVPLFIPCHRVVPAAGGLGNYSMGGPAVKESLLRREGVDVDRLQALARKGFRFEGSRTTRIFCLPGCRHIQPEHQVYFTSADQAAAQGYRPCKVCRPV